VSGTPEAGREAEAVVVKRGDGSVVALEIEVGDKKDIKPAQTPARPTPRPAVTPTPAGETQKVSGRLTNGAENVVVIGDLKCEVRANVFLLLLRNLNIKPGELAEYLRKNEVNVTAAVRRTPAGTCIIEEMDRPWATSPATGTPRPNVPPTATPRPDAGQALEKLAARIDQLDGRVWRIGDRAVIVPPKVRVEVKAGSAVTLVVRKIDRERLKEWLDEGTLKEVLENRLYIALVLRSNLPVYIVEKAEVAQTSP
jgi:hypothetical protein